MKWQNWSGSVTANPARIATPHSESEIAELVRQSTGTVRVAGSGHSFVPLCDSNDLLLSLDNLRGIVSIDAQRQQATVWAGTKLHELGRPLFDVGLALENMGDIDRQALAGAVATGTHGTGRGIGNMSTQVVGLQVISPTGERVTIDAESTPDLFNAARVSLGAFGVMTCITLQLLPAYRLHERTWIDSYDDCISSLDDYIAATRHFEFFWSPVEDACACKALQPTVEAARADTPSSPSNAEGAQRYVGGDRIDDSYRIFPSERNRLFNEMEFALPEAAGLDCLTAIRRLMLHEFPEVRWPIEYRTLAADDIWLSPAYQRETVTISIHQAAELPCRDFFMAAEKVFRAYEGRPHWGKMHFHSAEELAALYPMWDRFHATRRQFDPDGRFMNDYLRSNIFRLPSARRD